MVHDEEIFLRFLVLISFFEFNHFVLVLSSMYGVENKGTWKKSRRACVLITTNVVTKWISTFVFTINAAFSIDNLEWNNLSSIWIRRITRWLLTEPILFFYRLTFFPSIIWNSREEWGGGKIFDIEIPIQLKFRLREFNKRKENFSMEQQNIRCFIQRKIFPRFVND